ncbi:glycine zipper 2TM domain-containing protein [Scandinavium sp. H11S7]|uniref:Glycine zipper 2TM domain-containing protein n=1 Tax=Scandinavium hiltneri TaxID=2926519 RepID=A0ABT2E502_9ENTR|nr:glycine zipper 2TM domain-containing protein [Scandinavium hiltneri]MCS2162944.1 glycine zipper 2TM domain-containing protein [Scandinavium hiltneri]
MKKSALIAVSFLLFASQSSFAGSKTLVEYGVVQQSRVISQANGQYHPLRTVAAGALGGVVGHQFGNGKGKTAMTVGGALAGAGASRYHQSTQQAPQQVDLLIKTESGATIDVVQSYTGGVVFNPGDKVRILTKGSDTTVDKSL